MDLASHRRVPYHRITRIPIKDGSIDGIIAVAKTPKFVEHIKTFEGFIGVEVVADGTSHMITHSRWRDKESCDGGVAALGSVLKNFLSAFLRGPPEAPIVGEQMNYWDSPILAILGVGCLPAAVGNAVGDLLGKRRLARRITHFALKPGPESLQAVLAVMNKPSTKKLFNSLQMSECVAFSADAGSFSVCATYPSMEKLEAATASINLILKEEIGPHLVSPPKPISGPIVWRHTM